jgi:hypothetical protein
MSYVLELKIFGVPQSQNRINGLGWRNRHNNAVKWKALVKNQMRLIGAELPMSPLTKAKLILRRFGHRELDFDGLVASFKPVVDGLCQIRQPSVKVGKKRIKGEIIWPGVLIDDSYKITGPWDVDQKTIPKAEQTYITVRVEEVSDAS